MLARPVVNSPRVSNCLRPPMKSENELFFGTIAPPMFASKFCVRRRLDVDEWIAAAEHAVAYARRQAAADRANAGRGDDVDAVVLRGVVFRRERVADDADRADDVAGRQLAAVEAVDPHERVAAGHFHQLAHQLVWIVGRAVDLVIGQLRREGAAVGIRGAACG